MRFFRDEPTYGGAWPNSTEETLKKSSGTMKWDSDHRRSRILTNRWFSLILITPELFRSNDGNPFNVSVSNPRVLIVSHWHFTACNTGCSSLTIWASRYGRDFPCRIHFPVRYVPL